MSEFFNTFFGIGFMQKYLLDHASLLHPALYVAMGVLSVLLMAIVAYLLGSLNFAIIISGKKYKEDIRSFGSKNAGMTNMMRTYGKSAAGWTLLGDAMKAVVSCLIGYAVFGEIGAYVSGLFCMMGHMFPLYYGFRGGKGVVTVAATILMCNPLVFAILFTMFVILVLLTKFISLGSVMCMLLFPLVLDRVNVFFVGQPPHIISLVSAIMMTVLVVVKHKENIGRLLRGQENKFSFKKSVKAPESDQTDES